MRWRVAGCRPGHRGVTLLALLAWWVPGPAPGVARAADGAVPAVNLRPALKSYGLMHRPQGDRGTCSVFTMAAAIEFAVAKRQQNAGRLSVEFLNWAANQVTGEQQDGSFFSDLWKGFQSYGICPESDLPYAERFDASLRPSDEALQRAGSIKDMGLRLHWIKEWNPHVGLNEEQFGAVKEALRRGWPVCGGFLWPRKEHWTEGVLEMAPRSAVRDGHSVLLVGFQDDPRHPGGGVFLIRNSGPGPRDGAVTFEYVRAYMNDAAWVGD